MRRIVAKYVYPLTSVEPIVNGYVELDDDGTIISCGACESIPEGVEYYDGAIVPGFVNSHCHVELSHLHTKFVKGTGMAGFIDQINALRDWAGAEVKTKLVEEWMDIMWKRGVSAMADISNDESSFPVKKVSPMYTRTFLEVFGSEKEMCEGVMSDVKKLKEIADSYGIDAAPTPHSCYTMSPELLTASAKAGLESGYLSYHSQESQEEEDLILSGTGALYENRKKAGMSTPPVLGKSSLHYFIQRLAQAHPAPYDEHILLVHNVCLTQEAIDAAKEVMNNPYWALCPLSNIFIHNALPPVDLMRKNGLKITIGTDSLSSNEDYDMIKEIKCLQDNFEDLELGEILSWACKNGAEFLSKENELGRILPGMRPGLVLVRGIDESGRLLDGCTSERLA